MSFSASFEVNNGVPVQETVHFSNLLDPRDQESAETYSQAASPHDEVFAVACEHAMRVIESGALGDPEGRFELRITGHGNPDHEPVNGWANDFVQITLTQI